MIDLHRQLYCLVEFISSDGIPVIAIPLCGVDLVSSISMVSALYLKRCE